MTRVWGCCWWHSTCLQSPKVQFLAPWKILKIKFLFEVIPDPLSFLTVISLPLRKVWSAFDLVKARPLSIFIKHKGKLTVIWTLETFSKNWLKKNYCIHWTMQILYLTRFWSWQVFWCLWKQWVTGYWLVFCSMQILLIFQALSSCSDIYYLLNM